MKICKLTHMDWQALCWCIFSDCYSLGTCTSLTSVHHDQVAVNLIFDETSVLVFILTLLLLSADFYYLKNIAGRRLVGLRWWNEVNTATGDSHWVFESSDPNIRIIRATDKRFFWLSLYITPALWIGLAFVALFQASLIWLSLVGEFSSSLLHCQYYFCGGVAKVVHSFDVVIALILTITNTVAFSRCDQFSQASTFASNALSGRIASNITNGLLGRLFKWCCDSSCDVWVWNFVLSLTSVFLVLLPWLKLG